mmetsp:Transcript_27817/g.71619  ORF Transcript_27817/g.71619 Transcript_27817/m.71619 type:complete len:317 (-) Transcript_27817:234-1184(-)
MCYQPPLPSPIPGGCAPGWHICRICAHVASDGRHLNDHLVINLAGLVQLAPLRVHVGEHTVRVRQLGALLPWRQHRLAELAHAQQVALRLLVLAQLLGGGAQPAARLALRLPGGVELVPRGGDADERALKAGLGLVCPLLLQQLLALAQQRHHLLLALVLLAHDRPLAVDLAVHLLAHRAVRLHQFDVELLHLLGALARRPAARSRADQRHPLAHKHAVDEVLVVDLDATKVDVEGGRELLVYRLDALHLRHQVHAVRRARWQRRQGPEAQGRRRGQAHRRLGERRRFRGRRLGASGAHDEATRRVTFSSGGGAGG